MKTESGRNAGKGILYNLAKKKQDSCIATILAKLDKQSWGLGEDKETGENRKREEREKQLAILAHSLI